MNNPLFAVSRVSVRLNSDGGYRSLGAVRCGQVVLKRVPWPFLVDKMYVLTSIYDTVSARDAFACVAINVTSGAGEGHRNGGQRGYLLLLRTKFCDAIL